MKKGTMIGVFICLSLLLSGCRVVWHDPSLALNNKNVLARNIVSTHIKIYGELTGSESITVTGDSNLKKGVKLSIAIQEYVRRPGLSKNHVLSGEQPTGPIVAEKEVTVGSNGHFTTEIDRNGSKTMSKLTITFKPENQSESIKEFYGKYGEKISNTDSSITTIQYTHDGKDYRGHQVYGIVGSTGTKSPLWSIYSGAVEDEIIEVTAAEGTPDWTFQHLEKAVQDLDYETFMKFQNQNNPTFYKEQARWFEEVMFTEAKGKDVKLAVLGFKQIDETTGTVNFHVNMQQSEGSEAYTNNTVTYECIKAGNTWLINDLPFEQIVSESGDITVYFKPGDEAKGQSTLEDTEKLVNFYSKQFNWDPSPITIKLYSTNEEISATVPSPSLAGWNETGESLKINTADKIEDTFSILSHELTHKMLSDLTNDNAAIYLQEGFATYLQNRVQKDEAGAIYFDDELVDTNTKKAIENNPKVLSIEELNELSYSDDIFTIYRDGYLMSNYLIKTYGMEKFSEVLNDLAAYEYIDKRIEHKMETIQPLTIEAFEKVYGPVDALSKEYIDYYSD
ncbi:hypothetical protein ACOJQI_03105 [Bacillus salacetis]|uniref:hypothetical protein n=1 Tax=Bacillus salacetis TaxID=2315464 RepID=UPI003BA0EDFD